MSNENLENPTKLLMVEDDPGYRSLCVRRLERDRQHDYQIVACGSGKEAISAAQEENFECLLIDYRLPDMKGTECIETLREILGEVMPPAVIMTADGGEAAAIQAVRVQAADYLSKKDASPRGLCRSVQNAVEKGRLLQRIRQRSEELKAVNTELERKAIEIQRFYHTVSHEMKTPLTAVREFVSIIDDGLLGPVTDRQHEILQHALGCCDQINTQFNDLLDLTRLETGKLTLEFVSDSLNDVLSRAQAMVDKSARDKSIQIERRGELDLPSVTMDPGRITQVVSNVLGNSVKFTNPGGRIRITTRVIDNQIVRVRILDTGVGIPRQHLSEIFERLYQIDRSDLVQTESGLGLGLSIAREIVRGHGHELRVQSRHGTGSSFSFDLGIASADISQ